MGKSDSASKVAIAIHGGSGIVTRSEMTDEREAAIRGVLETSVRAGHRALLDGASSLEAVRAAINVMEDSPLFNAGHGAVFNTDGEHELDASVMDGATLDAGAVAAVRHIANPIDLALSVMSDSEHVMLIGEGAEAFACGQGFEMVAQSYFDTDFRREQLQKIKAREAAEAAANERDDFYSTVGAVALDMNGNLAAGTSTGGTANKRFGRVGDSPIIGAGTYADNAGCAVSGTGHGEFFMRFVVAYNICNRVALGTPVVEAADAVINDVLVKARGEGGAIAVDRKGNIAMPFNTEGMYRASIDTDGRLTVAIYRGEGEARQDFLHTAEH
ncbi:MAG: isoaspartyl peptidase/L-asparaginase [Lysobacterales bacterium]|jgi:beta-aspartyl-peptidase (threonine type)